MIEQSELLAIASRLGAKNPTSATFAKANAGSDGYKIIAGNGTFAIKHYTNQAEWRQQTEAQALELMKQHGLGNVPKIVGEEPNYTLLEWIDCTPIGAPTARDIDEAAIFVGTLEHISRKVDYADFPVTAKACLSAQMLVDNLQNHVSKLMPLAQSNKPLMQFLTSFFLPAFQKRLVAAKKISPDFSKNLPNEKQTLVASDFGFHNMRRTIKDEIIFVGFDYFGWDDPVTLASNFLLDPHIRLDNELKTQFFSHMKSVYGTIIEPRFLAYYPLHGLHWTLYLLNNSDQNHSGSFKESAIHNAQLMIEQSTSFL